MRVLNVSAPVLTAVTLVAKFNFYLLQNVAVAGTLNVNLDFEKAMHKVIIDI